METPSFKLVLCCALVTLFFLSVSVIVGTDLPSGRTFDFVFTQSEMNALMSVYTPADISAHRSVTAGVDMFFPFVYGAFFYFAVQRYASVPWVYLLILWVMIGAIFDFTENATILKILNGEDAFALKTVFTRAKFVFLVFPILFCTLYLFLDVFAGKNRKVSKKR